VDSPVQHLPQQLTKHFATPAPQQQRHFTPLTAANISHQLSQIPIGTGQGLSHILLSTHIAERQTQQTRNDLVV